MTKPPRRKQHRKVETSAAAADALFNAVVWAAGKLVDGARWILRRGKKKDRGETSRAPDGEN